MLLLGLCLMMFGAAMCGKALTTFVDEGTKPLINLGIGVLIILVGVGVMIVSKSF